MSNKENSKVMENKKYEIINSKVLCKFIYHTTYRDKLNGIKIRTHKEWRVYDKIEDFNESSIWFCGFQTKKNALEYCYV